LRRGKRKQQHGRAFFVVAGQVVEILFLHEDVRWIRFFVAGIAEEHDGGIDGGDKLRAALGKDGVRLALEGGSQRRKTSEQEQNYADPSHRPPSIHAS